MKNDNLTIHEIMDIGLEKESQEFTPVEINPFPTTKRYIIKPSEERLEKDNNETIEILTKKFSINHEIEYLKLDVIDPMDEFYIKFNPYSEDEHLALKDSIKNYGLLSPIIVWKQYRGNYYILAGLERWKCFVEFYLEAHESKDEEEMKKYETIPCFVIDVEEIDDLRARDLMLDSNLCSRKIDPMSLSKAISYKLAIKIKEQEMRKELNLPQINIMDELSQEFMRSKPTLYGYKKLENLCKGAAFLLEKGRISLKSAKALSKYSKETQITLINSIGVEKINDLKLSVFCNLEDEDNKKSLISAIKLAKECEYPFFSKVTIKFASKHGKVIIEKLKELLSKLPKEYLVKVRFPKLLI